ncbi:MAG: holo-ACP synthase [Candidatus Omnitrophica bacterium]|nr:holo-ACP synthase [Candidatus Omnitrophota bacterium]MDD5487427.1 holo-ACP synthase [Candidatus Omnitrophota bacterium]
MDVLGIGIDAVKVDRFRKAVESYGEVFLRKIFTGNELSYADLKKDHSMHMAGKFAAKEAVKKALPDGARIGLSWADIEILNQDDGKPYVMLHGEADKIVKKHGIKKVLVSISHTRDLATANAVVVGDDRRA